MKRATKTATFADDTGTGHRWAMTDWAGFRATRDDMGTRGEREALDDVRALVKRGVVVTVLGDAPGSSEMRAAAGGAK